MAQVTGTVFITIDGEQVQSKPGASLMFGGFERTAVVTNDRVSGYTETPVAAEVEFTLAHRSDTDVIGLRDLRNATVMFGSDTGKLYMVANAFTTTPPRLSGGEGDLEMKMAGDPAEEIA